MAKTLLDNDNKIYYAAAAIVLVLVAAFVLTGNTGAVPAANNAAATPSAAATAAAAQPGPATCKNGEQKEFLCVGSISGTQTYYECVGGAWESKSRYNYSECVTTFGPNETNTNATENPAMPTATNMTASATPKANVTAVPSAVPSQTPASGPSTPAFINLTVDKIRTSNADLYWLTNANATGMVWYGDEPGVRRWTLAAQVPGFSQYQRLTIISPNKTYYFEVEACFAGACIKTPTLNFSTPVADKYFYDDTTIFYPGGQVNYTAAQLNTK